MVIKRSSSPAITVSLVSLAADLTLANVFPVTNLLVFGFYYIKNNAITVTILVNIYREDSLYKSRVIASMIEGVTSDSWTRPVFNLNASEERARALTFGRVWVILSESEDIIFEIRLYEKGSFILPYLPILPPIFTSFAIAWP
jgi:hypothetical protein